MQKVKLKDRQKKRAEMINSYLSDFEEVVKKAYLT